MKVVLISHYFDTKIGGIGSYSQLVYESIKNSVQINKISLDDCIMPKSFKSNYLFYNTVDLKRILSKKKYEDADVFHCLNPHQSIYAPKNKSVCNIHDFFPLIMHEDIKQKIFLKLFEKCLKTAIECKRIIVLNSDLKEILISEYNVDESIIDVIPPAVDNKYHPQKKKNDSFVVGTVSALSNRKRVDILLDSFLKADIENSKLLIGGNGPEIENLKIMANNDERVEFLGFVADKDMNDFYNSLDVFVFPTENEGYGMPIVEAMACGKPVITLEDGNIPTSLKQHTYVCPKEELSDVLLNKTYSCNINKNFQFVKQHSLKNTGKKILKIYDEI